MPNCPADGSQLEELGALLNTTVAGKYVLQQEIGEGGWGTVYLAQHVELGSRFAVKVLSLDLCQDRKHIDRFRQESHTLAKLEHPGVVRVIDCGLSPRPFIVMEYAQGQILSDLLAQKGRLSDKAVYAVARRLAETLAYAHALGVVHQDIKPGNIMVRDLDLDTPDLKLLDFGVARLIDSDAIAEQSGESFGSPEYMSPEQFLQDQSLGPKTDIYSLGCVLFECMFGRRPFKATSYIEWSSVHRHVRPSYRQDDLSKLGKELARLSTICMAKNPEERPSAAELVQQLKQAMASTQSRTVPIPAPSKMTLPPFLKGKEKLLAGIGGVFLLGILTALCIPLFTPKPAPVKNLQEISDSSKQDLITTLSAAPQMQKVSTETIFLDAAANMDETSLKVYRPKTARAMILVLASQKKELEELLDFWAEHGFLVAVAQVSPKSEEKELSALMNASLKALSQKSDFSDFAFVGLGLDFDQSLSVARAYAADSSKASSLSAFISIDPRVGEDAAASAKEYHEGEFPVFTVLDASMNEKRRAATARRAKTAFTFGAGRQVYYDSNRVSLFAVPAYRDQQVLMALLTGFLDSSLTSNRAKESYLYSQKAIMAVGSAAELRFR
ncbi:MAG: protein kinase [Candidatus Obscuribacterales bacterium]|nr:protein kinase [Candidatus Obscuribacterales bacterium]